MTKLGELNKAISSIDTNDYMRAIKTLGSRPVSEIVYLKKYKPKREILDEQIRKTKREVVAVSTSLTALDNNLADILNIINKSLKKLEDMYDDADIIKTTNDNLKKMQRHVVIIENNIVVLKNKLAELGYTVG